MATKTQFKSLADDCFKVSIHFEIAGFPVHANTLWALYVAMVAYYRGIVLAEERLKWK